MKVKLFSIGIAASVLLGLQMSPPLEPCTPGTEQIFEVEGSALEGITVTKDGSIYASGDETGKVFKYTPDGVLSEITLIPEGVGAIVGLTSDPSGNVYADVNHWFDPGIHGVWRIKKDDSIELLANIPLGGLLNSITIDPKRNLYVSDSFLGAIWRISPKGEVELWLQDEILMDSLGWGFGINGVDFYRKAIYASITLDGRIVKIPIERDGTAGEPEVYVEDPSLFGVDQAIMDRFGNLYVANVFFQSILLVDEELEITTLIVGSPDIFGPASLSRGARDDQFSIFVTNFENAGNPFGFPPQVVDDVTRIDVCPPGLK